MIYNTIYKRRHILDSTWLYKTQLGMIWRKNLPFLIIMKVCLLKWILNMYSLAVCPLNCSYWWELQSKYTENPDYWALHGKQLSHPSDAINQAANYKKISQPVEKTLSEQVGKTGRNLRHTTSQPSQLPQVLLLPPTHIFRSLNSLSRSSPFCFHGI